MSKPDAPEIKSCTDGGCIFGHPGGMHTNGGCSCLRPFGRGADRRHIERNILLLRQEIQRLRDVREELRHALEHIQVCPESKLCPDCRELTGQAMKRPATMPSSEERSRPINDPVRT